jgi:hypothetical protein
MVRAAIEASGYPLQTIVAQELRSKGPWAVQEEWSYLDKDSGELRALDIAATIYAHGQPERRVRPQVDLLVECKQAALPYVFFLSSGSVWLPRFPIVAGLRGDNIGVTSDDDRSTWNYTVIHALGLGTHDFCNLPPVARSFSKCARKSSELELSGSEAYNGLILPLVKALQHFETANKPPSTFKYFSAHLVCALGVLDAPLIGVDATKDPPTFSLIPWVRVIRQEYEEEAAHWEREKLWVVDVVHRHFFSRYVADHLLPFGREFARLAVKHDIELATGLGFVPGMRARGWHSVEQNLRPRPMQVAMRKSQAVIWDLVRRAFGRRQ